MRGASASDIAALKNAVVQFSQLAINDLIETIEINPLAALSNGSGVLALERLIELFR